jgi:DNA-3-methyladenine glycosylase
VLIRALEPTTGVSTMVKRRRQQDPRMLCAGPGRLGQALAITRELNGKRIDAAPFSLTAASMRTRVVCGPRVGISKAVERPLRFGLAGSRYLSRPFR